MKIRERLMECRLKGKISSDYKLAEVLGTSRQIISALMNGKQKPDAYIAVRMAEILIFNCALVAPKSKALFLEPRSKAASR